VSQNEAAYSFGLLQMTEFGTPKDEFRTVKAPIASCGPIRPIRTASTPGGFGPSLNLFRIGFDFDDEFDATVGWRTDDAGRVMLLFEKVCFGTATVIFAMLFGALVMLAAV
jgi:hypothetical protein